MSLGGVRPFVILGHPLGRTTMRRPRFDQMTQAPTIVLGVIATLLIRWARRIDTDRPEV